MTATLTTADLALAIRNCRASADRYTAAARQAFARGNYELGHWYAELADAATAHAEELTADLW